MGSWYSDRKLSAKKEGVSTPKLLLYLFGGVSILVTIALVIAFVVVWLPIKSFISDKPYAIEHIPISPEKEDAIKNKLISFFNRELGDTLRITSEEVNHLIRNNELINKYEVQYRIRLEDSLFNLRCSVPANKLKNNMASIVKVLNVSGYINAEMEGYLRLKGKKLSLITTRSQMNSRPAPFTLLGKRTHIDIVQFFPNRLEYNRIVDEFKSFRIHNKQVEIILNPLKPQG